ncbi:hypothetical protein RHMOL_Rhmol13G0269700 [Rhododendron molle]|uniref:Uncharacterized protein n=1 Tax=Rhododendron molle TaxID=49168 RepID=A0ACC0LB50_RHOML|nr:hypothetical protein RHMOL_Rhmol13G0269700 [Rhododendron molle]
MAVTFSDLHTEAGLKSLDKFLSGKTYISGDQLTKDDIKVYAAVSLKVDADDIKVYAAVSHKVDAFPNVSKWYHCVSSQLAASFPGKAVGVKIASQGAPAEEVKKICEKSLRVAPRLDLRASVALHALCLASKEAPAGDDEDDLDLFGDETEEEKKAAEEREVSKAPAKKKESGKSSVLLDVKPWDDETDMKKLEEAVRSIEMPGLFWGASKLVPVGYGIKKLTIMMTIVDDLVSVDTLIEERLTVEPINEYVQSCDIVAFNKI